jgi:hypothetical protein
MQESAPDLLNCILKVYAMFPLSALQGVHDEHMSDACTGVELKKMQRGRDGIYEYHYGRKFRVNPTLEYKARMCIHNEKQQSVTKDTGAQTSEHTAYILLCREPRQNSVYTFRVSYSAISINA